MATEFRVKRIYEEPSADDGVRLLVDRLWPRGVSKEASKIDLWAKVLTPSTDLRKWLHHDPTRQEEFAVRFTNELLERRDAIHETIQSIQEPVVTLVTATKDFERGHIPVLRRFLESHFGDDSL